MQGSLYEEIVAKCYEAYQKIAQNQCMDFDDLIMNTIRLFNEQPDTLAFYQNKFTIFMWMNTKIPIMHNIP